jgi:predicted nucleic acid-binding protein
MRWMACAELCLVVDRGTTVRKAKISLGTCEQDGQYAHNLAMADAMIYATALATGARLVTLDAHFQGLPEATVF